MIKEQKNEEERQLIILDFLKSAGLVVDNSMNTLEGQLIPRDMLVHPKNYDDCHAKLEKLKKCMSSSRLTCLQSNAEEQQKWPLLNAVRQILRTHHYKMTPIRLSNGYTKEGKKILVRFFRIEKMKSTNNIEHINMINNDENEFDN